ncbi:transporter substrate-binding domain-containing protein [Curvibacter sp. APW13]|uniref:substrate-binding periplasmic protein n=1 Tax=Curvibacter sp. APW13 TaxID=3077236 RepID=UPI0028E06A88|nr:transporter substrate-binding domain-containing protein [Curvibacter sp. APW13]MDT8992476.1 transporter substrate-binding domain-containing protein [Curvibacter sp. APW13]
MRWKRILACALGVFACAVSAQALRVQFQEASAPKYLEADANHPAPYGLCPDIMAALERQDASLRFELDPVPRPQKRIEFDLGSASKDVMCGLLKSPERLQVAYPLETPVYLIRERMAARKDDTLVVATIEDLARSGALVAVQTGAAYYRKLKDAGVQVVESGGSDVAVRAVANGQARFFYTNSLTAAHFIRAERLERVLRLHPGVMDTSPAYFWVAKHVDPGVVKRLEAAMKRLKRSGELDRIYARYD